MANSLSLSPNQGWIAVLIPALLYYIFLSPTKTPLLSYLNLLPSYFPLETTLILENGINDEIKKIFDSKNNFEIVIEDDDASFYDTTWVEDTELGRGYLLISDSSSNGKVWRYEMGGGIIPIGKSLYLDQSGCRSGHMNECDGSSLHLGSKGLAVQVTKDEERFDIGALLIAESGEKRIIRLENDGARTPIVLDVPSLCDDGKTFHRLENPGQVVYTPFGDLLFTEQEECHKREVEGSESSSFIKTGIYRVKDVVNIPSIPFKNSRDAHKWTLKEMIEQHMEVAIDVPYSNLGDVSDLLIGKEMTSIYISSRKPNDNGCTHAIHKIEEDLDLESTETKDISKLPIFFEMTKFYEMSNSCSEGKTFLTIDDKGNLFATFPGGLVIIDKDGDHLATIKIQYSDQPSLSTKIQATSLTIANDGYMYLTTESKLLRLKLKSKMLNHPTNMIVPKRK